MPIINLTKKDIDEMEPSELQSLLLKATRIQGTAVVSHPDGSVKYDDVSKAGQFCEDNLE